MLSRKLITSTPGVVRRGYFSMLDRFRDKINIPMRHLRSFFELDGHSYTTSLPSSTAKLHGNSGMNFQAYLTGNAFDMNQWHEMENTVHSQFGTVDNPVIIFSSDSTWRTVVCMGPGSEEDAYTHERMYYIVREGPLHRCHLCGQVFKLVRLKDQFSEINDYYSHMFSPISQFEISEQDMTMGMTSVFSDRMQITMESMPSSHVYIQVNADEADHMMVDPAYRMEKAWEAQEKYFAMQQAYEVVEAEVAQQQERRKLPFNRDFYDNWWKIEKSIRKFDRIFNQLERFEGRKLLDAENHERREKRMIDRKRQRWTANFTYFFGGLTEEEQMFRDYYETDVEEHPELYDERSLEMRDEMEMAQTGDFAHDRFDFMEFSLTREPHEEITDVVDKLVFKHRYRMANDAPEVFMQRMQRVYDRFMERAGRRDPSIEQDLSKLFREDEIDQRLGVSLTDEKRMDMKRAQKATEVTREYMVEEALQQYKDYYESDEEEQRNFELLDNLTPRDKLRMIEVFTDYSRVDLQQDGKRYVTIPKRHHDPELSFMNNLYLDLIDFRDRVKPLANDLALMDQASVYQAREAKSMPQSEKQAPAPVEEEKTIEAEDVVEHSPSSEEKDSEN